MNEVEAILKASLELHDYSLRGEHHLLAALDEAMEALAQV
jgi:hypothetical protein